MLAAGGQQAEVLQEAEHWFAQDPSGSGEPKAGDAVWVALLAAWAAGEIRSWSTCLHWADRGLALRAGYHRKADIQGRLRFCAGSALTCLGDLYRAERELLRALQLSDQESSLSRLRGDAMCNLGFLNRLLRRPDAELSWFRQAVSQYTAEGRMVRVIACRHEVAWCHLNQGRPGEALPELEEVQGDLEVHGCAELRADLQIAVAYYHCVVGEYDRAREICGELMPQPDLLCRQRADLAWLLGLDSLAAGDLVQARRWAAEAHAAAVEDWWPPQLERIDQLRVRACSQPSYRGR